MLVSAGTLGPRVVAAVVWTTETLVVFSSVLVLDDSELLLEVSCVVVVTTGSVVPALLVVPPSVFVVKISVVGASVVGARVGAPVVDFGVGLSGIFNLSVTPKQSIMVGEQWVSIQVKHSGAPASFIHFLEQFRAPHCVATPKQPKQSSESWDTE